MEDNAGTWSYMAQDGLGSIRAEIDASQNYAPFGTIAADVILCSVILAQSSLNNWQLRQI